MFGKIVRTWVTIAIAIVVIGFLLIWPLTWAWNFVMPDIFGLPEITYWQMFVLYMLCQFLFRANVNVKTK